MHSALVLLPFLGVVMLNLPLQALMKRISFWLCLLILAVQALMVVCPFSCAWTGKLDIFGSFLSFNFVVDGLSRVLLLSISIVLFSALFVEKYILAEKERMFNFVNMLLLILMGMNGVVMVRDIFSLYVFLEITAVSSFILIGFNKDFAAFESAFKYIILSVVATVLMLSAIALLLMVAGDTSFSAINLALKSSPDKLLISVAVGVFLCACFIKAGLMPFHGWLPDVYSSAPASVSVALAGIVTKTVGVYTLIIIVNSVFGFTAAVKNILLAVGIFSAVAGALAAFGQNDFKRMLAYSSISQVGYIILGLGCGSALGLMGAVFHLFNHSIFKTLLFVNSAAVEKEAGTRDMDRLSGLTKQMPVTGITSVLGTLSCAGIPPLAGFWSKLIIIIALWSAGFYTYAAIAILVGVLTLGYLLSMQRRVFFGEIREDLLNIKEADFNLLLPALVLAAITIGVGLAFPFVAVNFIQPASKLLGG